ncbi:alkaline phosphatase [Scopulibacillus darangshiensis]|uniref:alkaline phosphatase n=1 Tax=Scopulibacillus darangshiensis TaxID=442528 RepID=UPI001FB3E077|nr:alkaline phosphatase [Scopulibacillus darangshiensis]
MKKRGMLILNAAIALTTVTALTFASFADASSTERHEKKSRSHHHGMAKNVILFVGDGMGPGHRNAIRLAAAGADGELAMNDMPYSGMVHTSSTSLVTDSAAAATAMAAGIKTYNGAISVDPDKQPVKTVLELAEKAGKATGVVTTSQVTDATPAAFGAHVADRSSQSDIAKQYLENSDIDVILGGGEDYWYPKGSAGKYPDHPAKDPEEESKGTEGNLVKKARKLGYNYVTNQKELEKAKGDKLLGLFANEEMFEQRPEGEGDLYKPVVPLPEMTKKAIDTLSRNNKGFFLMVEEEGIDEMSHENNAKQMIKAGKQLDKSVEVAKKFAKKHPDTLVLVTADHGCGGISIEDVSNKDESGEGISKEDGPIKAAHLDQQFTIDWTTSGHSAVDVPLTAMGPGAQLFAGVYENTHIHDALIKAMRLKQ